MILIYNDIGVGDLSFDHTVFMCQTLWPHIQHMPVKASHIKNGELENAQLFIMPGGGDSYYLKALGSKGNNAIQHFVQKGGTYLGICAGAYYATDRITWAAGTSDEIIAARPLKFFPGEMVGPTYEPYDAFSLKGVRSVLIDTACGPIPMYYNGGGYFICPNQFKESDIIGIYTDLKLPAIADCRVGKGRAVLSSLHIETDPLMLDTKQKAFHAIQETLIKGTSQRLDFIRSLCLIN